MLGRFLVLIQLYAHRNHYLTPTSYQITSTSVWQVHWRELKLSERHCILDGNIAPFAEPHAADLSTCQQLTNISSLTFLAFKLCFTKCHSASATLAKMDTLEILKHARLVTVRNSVVSSQMPGHRTHQGHIFPHLRTGALS